MHAQRFDPDVFREEAECLEGKYREEHSEIIERVFSELDAMPEQERGTEAIQDFRTILEKVKGSRRSNLEVAIVFMDEAVRLKESALWEEYSLPSKVVLRISRADILPFIKDQELVKSLSGAFFAWASLDFRLIADKVERRGGRVKVIGPPNAKVRLDISGKNVEVDVASVARWLELSIKEKSAVWARANCRWRDRLVEQLEREADRLEEQIKDETDSDTKRELTSLLREKLKEAQKKAKEAVKEWKRHKENWPDEMHVVPRPFHEATVRLGDLSKRLKNLDEK